MTREVESWGDKVVVTDGDVEIAIFPVGAGIEEAAMARAVLFRGALDMMDAVELFGVASQVAIARARSETP